MPEQWRSIPSFEGYYEVSDEGRVRSLDRMVPHRHNKSGFSRWKGRIIAPNYTQNGYINVRIFKEGIEYVYGVHRLVMLAFVGPSDLEVNHKDFNRLNNKLYNLEYMSVVHNRHYSANNHSISYKLSKDDIKSVIDMHINGDDMASIGRKFNVTDSTVYYHLKKHGYKEKRT